MTTHKYAQMQSKAKRDITREMDGEKNTFIRFRGILRTREDNLQFVEKPADEDTRTRQQKRHYYRHEVTKTMEAKKVTKDRKSTKKKVEATASLTSKSTPNRLGLSARRTSSRSNSSSSEAAALGAASTLTI